MFIEKTASSIPIAMQPVFVANFEQTKPASRRTHGAALAPPLPLSGDFNTKVFHARVHQDLAFVKFVTEVTSPEELSLTQLLPDSSNAT